jgi:hypothetical protein
MCVCVCLSLSFASPVNKRALARVPRRTVVARENLRGRTSLRRRLKTIRRENYMALVSGWH